MVLCSEALCEINNRTVYDLLAFILFFLFYIFSLKIQYKLNTTSVTTVPDPESMNMTLTSFPKFTKL